MPVLKDNVTDDWCVNGSMLKDNVTDDWCVNGPFVKDNVTDTGVSMCQC